MTDERDYELTQDFGEQRRTITEDLLVSRQGPPSTEPRIIDEGDGGTSWAMWSVKGQEGESIWRLSVHPYTESVHFHLHLDGATVADAGVTIDGSLVAVLRTYGAVRGAASPAAYPSIPAIEHAASECARALAEHNGIADALRENVERAKPARPSARYRGDKS